MKLTDVITSRDVMEFLHHHFDDGTPAVDVVMHLFNQHDKEFFELRELFVTIGFDRGEAGSLLSFLDGALRCKKPQ